MTEERLHIINLRREFLKAPRYMKTKKAVSSLKEFIAKHRKVDIKNVRIGRNLNLKLWERGRKNPPSKIKVKSIIQESKAYVELPEFQFEEIKKIESKKEPKKVIENLKDKLETKEEKKEDLKTLQKEEMREERKEHHHDIPLQPDKHTKDIKAKGEAKVARKSMPATGKKDSHEGKP